VGRFLNISESSLAEVAYCIHVALRLGYITLQTYQPYPSFGT